MPRVRVYPRVSHGFSRGYGYGYEIADPAKTRTRTRTRYSNARHTTKYGCASRAYILTFTTTSLIAQVSYYTKLIVSFTGIFKHKCKGE
jgi:hypothetical protein